jgi:hypothetical protein
MASLPPVSAARRSVSCDSGNEIEGENHDRGFNDSGLITRPSELFRRNCWISFEPVEGARDVLADYIGPEKILWATDYPHADGFFPGAPAMIVWRAALSEATRSGILGGGAIGFYGLS